MTQSPLYRRRRGRPECSGASWRGIGAVLLFLTAATTAFAQASGDAPPAATAPFGDAHVRTQPVPTIPTAPAGSTEKQPAEDQQQDLQQQGQPPKPPATLVEEAPYRGWKHHVVRKPEDAIVLVRYHSAGITAPEATVTGLVVRCDGFILVPRSVRDALRNSEAGAHGGEAIITPVDTTEKQAAAPIAPLAVPVHPHPGAHPSVSYALIKTTGFHVPCLPVLNSANVVSGMPVIVLTAVPAKATAGDASTGGGASTAFTVVSRKAVVGRAAAAAAERDSFLLDGIESVKGQPAAIPAGSIVIDAQSGGAVGVVASESSGPGAMPAVFTTFARLNVIADEIAIAPDRAAVRLSDVHGDKHDTAAAPAGMVWVPGGAVRLSGDSYAARAFEHDYQTDVVCTPGFYAGIYPVTRQEYGDWLASKAIRNLPLQPYALHMTTLPRLPDLPASGMTALDALRYAGEHQERLLTETEWRRASFVTSVAWAREKDRLANEATLRIFRSLLASSEQASIQGQNVLAEQMAQEAAVKDRGLRPGVVNRNIPTIKEAGVADEMREFDLPGDADFDALFNAVDAAQHQEKWPWRFVHPVGLFPEDVSVFGLCDVVTNPREFLQNTGTGAVYGEKAAPAEIDPDYTMVHHKLLGGYQKETSIAASDGTWIRHGAPQIYRDVVRKYGENGGIGGENVPQVSEQMILSGADIAAQSVLQLLLWHNSWADQEAVGAQNLRTDLLSKTGLTQMEGFLVLPYSSSGEIGGRFVQTRTGITDMQQQWQTSATGVKVLHIAAEARGDAFPIFRCAR